MSTSISEPRVAAGSATGYEATTGPQLFYARYFFVAMAGVFIVINSLGFVPQLVFIHAQHLNLHWFTHVHGAVMTVWLLLFLVQASLAAKGRLEYHRMLGLFSVGWGVIVLASLGIVVFGSLVRDNPPEASMRFATLALSLVGMVMFGLFFTWGICARKNAGVHKRMIFFAMLPLMSAGIDRIGWLPALQSAYFVRFVYLDMLLIPLVVYDFITQRRIHRITLIGAACLILAQGVVVGAAGSPAWNRFVYRALTPFVVRVPEVALRDAQSDPLLGDYGGKDWKMTVSRDGGKLYLQMPNLPKWELGAYSETELFLKIDTVKLTFVKDPQGQVTKVVVTQPDKTWEAARVVSSAATTPHGDH